MMQDISADMIPYVESAEFPAWLPEKIRPLGINGLNIKGYGSPGLTALEAGSISFQMARYDMSATTFLNVHNGIGMAVIAELGDDEQKQRFLTKGMTFEKIFSFGLTEPLNGSDATGLQTSARKVEGGWVLNG